MRSGLIRKRPVQVDAVYKSKLITRFVQRLMQHGKKSTAEGILYSALEQLAAEKKDALSMFEQAVKNVMPAQEVRSRRVGGATYQVPMPVRHERSEALAIRWIVAAARDRKGKPMDAKLFLELKDAFAGTGSSIKKRDDVHKMAEANRAFAHFRM